ncbi:Piwi domain-containing protein [Glomus cerebriforme]|uniref:Piwi domain-containing protein n=1 Tax=Glomus cerebriforme TaxID=658196 RepID=A0A397SVY0_9GLOM|nr:Piwi domain-containing protein [Glomus cerebriforme]
MAELEGKIEQLTLKEEIKEKIAPRPGEGTLGTKVILRANHFKITTFPNLKLFLYNYFVTTSADKATGKKVRGKVFEECRKLNKFGKSLPVFNGNDMVYCSTKLTLENNKFKITLPPREDGIGKPSEFNITIKFKQELKLQYLKDYVDSKQGWDGDVQTCITALNSYINYKVRTNVLSVGRGIYPPSSQMIFLSGGAELKRGFCQSLRPGWSDLTINVDVCSGTFCPPGNAIDVAADILRRKKIDLRRGINDHERRTLSKVFVGLRFRVIHRENNKKSIYVVEKLSKESANRIMFRDEEQRETSVTDFFAKRYGMKLEYGNLPCFTVAKNCFPIEVCEIFPDQPFRGDITDDGRADMIKHTCVKPFERFKSIENSLQNVFRYNQDENMKSINMNVDTRMMTVEGRVLPPVSISFNKNSRQPSQNISDGRWNFVSQILQDGKKLVNWSILVLSGDSPNAVAQFAKQLSETLNKKGMNIVSQPEIVTFNPQGDIKMGLMQAAKKAMKSKGEMPLILVTMRERSKLYSDIKRIAETDLSVPTQCILSKHMRKPKGFEQFCVNVGLKINAKLGGRNCSLSAGQIDFISSAPTMVLGADVYHSGANEQHMPSIAAVCASMDAAATIYSGRYNVNVEPRNETIEKLDIMVIDLLKTFRAKNGRLPQRILFYRDGVSEGQFRKVMDVEVKMLRDAFKGGYGENPPKLTFIIVQKRHHTRFMPASQRDADRNGNCRPGTVVDKGIVVKQEFDFFLQSHASLLGTGRPTHYRVLVDDNKFKADHFQELTNKLCYLNARCTSAISIVTPACYAHLICNRARHYTVWEGSSSSEGSASCAVVQKQITNLMYFI